ncbi:hypothetical protein Tco_1510807 [Tanacetum coccineum]
MVTAGWWCGVEVVLAAGWRRDGDDGDDDRLHQQLEKVVSVGTAPGPNNSDHNDNTITNGDGILHSVC